MNENETVNSSVKNIYAWAKNEIELANREDEKHNDEHSDTHKDIQYYATCREKALDLFRHYLIYGYIDPNVVNEDGCVKIILKRLNDRKPLTPITDCEDEWKAGTAKSPYYLDWYESKRMPSLIKFVNPKTGQVDYTDTKRCIAICDGKPKQRYLWDLITDIIDDMFPITMPYMGLDEPYKVYIDRASDYVTDGIAYCTWHIMYAIEPYYGKKIPINRFFEKKTGNSPYKYEEITRAEYVEREAVSIFKHFDEYEEESQDGSKAKSNKDSVPGNNALV